MPRKDRQPLLQTQGCLGVPLQIPLLLYREGKAQRGKWTHCPMVKLPTWHLLLSNTQHRATISMDLQQDLVLAALSTQMSLLFLCSHHMGYIRDRFTRGCASLGQNKHVPHTFETALKPPGHKNLMPSHQFHNAGSYTSDFIATGLI